MEGLKNSIKIPETTHVPLQGSKPIDITTSSNGHKSYCTSEYRWSHSPSLYLLSGKKKSPSNWTYETAKATHQPNMKIHKRARKMKLSVLTAPYHSKPYGPP